MTYNWLELLTAALGGSWLTKIAGPAWTEYRRRADQSRSSRDLVQKHLDPILKAADELVGRIRSLARKDFRDLKGSEAGDGIRDAIELSGLMYLVAQFWARIQILRTEATYANIARDSTGKTLASFLHSLESSPNRLVGRAWQRGIGECLIDDGGNGFKVIGLKTFVALYQEDDTVREWFAPLSALLTRTNHTRNRQRILVYGAILHALTDFLDRKHLVTRDRDGWPNKLSNRSRRELQHQVFGRYLSFVKKPQKYFRPPVPKGSVREKTKRPPNFSLAATRSLGAGSRAKAASKPQQKE